MVRLAGNVLPQHRLSVSAPTFGGILKMRKSLWTILVVFIFTALGSTAAHADTIVASGGNVTAINGITIAGTTYDVTFGTTDDMTFVGNAANAAAANAAIVVDLSSDTYITAGGVCTVGVDGGLVADYAVSFARSCGFPSNGVDGVWLSGSVPTPIFTRAVANVSNIFLWDEFTVVPTGVPEPGTLSLTLTGVGLLGLTLVMRMRKPHGQAQTT
jgi:hypothetical protein